MMRLFISPAKKMRADVDFLQAEQLPQLLSKACELLEYCRGLTVQELKKLLCCNDGIAALNYERYRDIDVYKRQIQRRYRARLCHWL